MVWHQTNSRATCSQLCKPRDIRLSRQNSPNRQEIGYSCLVATNRGRRGDASLTQPDPLQHRTEIVAIILKRAVSGLIPLLFSAWVQGRRKKPNIANHAAQSFVSDTRYVHLAPGRLLRIWHSRQPPASYLPLGAAIPLVAERPEPHTRVPLK